LRLLHLMRRAINSMYPASELDRLKKAAPASTTLPHVRYKAYLFGPFRVMRDEQVLGEPNWRRNKAKTLLKWFLLNPGKFFSADQLSKLWWPDIEPTTAAKNMHITIHYLRHLLEPDLEAGQKSTFIRRNTHNFYWFDLNESWWVDIFEVERLTISAKEAENCGDCATAIAHHQKIIDYYNLGFLPEEVYEDPFSPYRRQHDYAYEQIFEKLMQLCTQANRLDDVLTYGLQALSLDPYCEVAVRAIVNVYLERGNVTGAIHMLDSFQNLLKQELRLAPSEEMRALRKNILRDY